MFRSNESSLSVGDRWLAGTLAACTTFIVGYTFARAVLTYGTGAIADDQEMVIPHQAELWKVFGE